MECSGKKKKIQSRIVEGREEGRKGGREKDLHKRTR